MEVRPFGCSLTWNGARVISKGDLSFFIEVARSQRLKWRLRRLGCKWRRTCASFL